MADVAVVGLGNMGSALAQALIDSGREVIVWNRSAERIRPFADRGVAVAANPAEAFASAPVVVTCLSDYAGLFDTLAGLRDRHGVLDGRTLVQLTSGSADDATELSAKLASAGASLIDGYVIAPPSAIGTDTATIIHSGPRQIFDQHRAILHALGPATYLGEGVGQANIVGRALAAVFYATIGGGLEAFAYVAEQGIDVATFAPLVKSALVSADSQLTVSAGQIMRGDFTGDEATIDVHERALARVSVQMAEVTGTQHRICDAMVSYLQDAQAAGHGAREISALDTVVRRN